ncbi:hypothetical protein J1N10_14395 [Carboxylicivirga sp. A043]|uniref:hypothetical protein n=1 Tax=Carboxylicivirga litoralis TaxID=2816963 RepID=UPI0021CB63CC|nr:hypothetical protein [Carboxylicivirga sp. A043]MCU4157173.1 hypothetical protein [Carboxylicivirga sp. A043]
MKPVRTLFFLLLVLIVSSCEQILDEALYGHQEARCEVVEKSSINKITEGRAILEVKVKNKGQLDACDLTVYASLIKDGKEIEQQSAYIGYLSSKKSTTVTITFYKVIYGSEYDSVDVDLWYDEVERDDYNDDEW